MTTTTTKERASIFFSATAILVAVLFLGALIPIRSQDVITSSAQALWNQDELYIFVSQNKVAWSQNVWSFSWRVVMGCLGIGTTPSFHRIDGLLYHVRNGAIEEHFVKNLNAGGIFAPYNGSLYSFVGGGPGTRGVFRWTGKSFVRLTEQEAKVIETSFTYSNELIAHEGWSNIANILPGREAIRKHAIFLNGVAFTLRATQTVSRTPSRIRTASKVELIRDGQPGSARVLYEFEDKVGFVSAAEYKQLVE